MSGPCILLAAAPTAPPCFRRWRRSSPLPQRGSPWQAGPLPTGRRRPDMAQKRGPRLRGQRLLDNAPCQAAVNLGSSALLFPRHRALLVQHRPDRHAKGSPSGRAGERSETERASPGQKSFCAAISRFFVRAILSLCFYISVSILALSVTFGDTSPKGRGFHAVERAQKAPRILICTQFSGHWMKNE